MGSKKCIGTKSIEGCDKDLPDDDFKVSSINKNTGAVYRKNICRKCEYKGNKKIKPKETNPEAKLFQAVNIAW